MHLDHGAVEPIGAGNGFSTVRWGSITETSIAMKELIPIDFAATMRGREWKGKAVCFKCDNKAVVAILQSLYSKDPMLDHLLHCLFIWASIGSFWFCAVHLPGADNGLADAIFRNSNDKFFCFFPQALKTPSGIS